MDAFFPLDAIAFLTVVKSGSVLLFKGSSIVLVLSIKSDPLCMPETVVPSALQCEQIQSLQDRQSPCV